MNAIELHRRSNDPTQIVVARSLSKPGSQGVWLKTHIRRHGHYVTATMYCVAPNKDGIADHQVFKATVDVRPILRRMVKLHDRMHGKDSVSGSDDLVGFSFKKLGRFTKKAWRAGKSKAARKVWNTTRSVMKSRITQGAVAATAIAFPAVGVPAAAALATANHTLDAIENGRRMVGQAEQIAGRLAKGKNLQKELLGIAKRHGKAYLRSYLQKNPQLKQYARIAMAYDSRVNRFLSDPNRKRNIKRTMGRYNKAKRFVSTLDRTARYGRGSAQANARKMQTILRLAAANRSRIRRMTAELEGGMPGLLIDSQGRFQGGRYVLEPRAQGTPDLLVTKTNVRRGRYRRVRLNPERMQRLAKLKQKQARFDRQVSRLRRTQVARPVTSQQKRGRRKTFLRRLRRGMSSMSTGRRRAFLGSLTKRLRDARRRASMRRRMRG